MAKPPVESNRVLVIFFDDIRGSTALKEKMAAREDEDAFQRLRKEHDALVEEVVTRDGEGQVVKSTGDGFLAVFYRPSVAVERCMEIQERLHGHHILSVRIGLDMGEVRVLSEGNRITDVFGRHVDWAARTAGMADGGHICVTKAVYTDAFSWLPKNKVAWNEHGLYRVKPGEPLLEIYEPHNANMGKPMAALHGERAAAPETPAHVPLPQPAPAPKAPAAAGKALRLVKPWEAVARDGREFAEQGGGMMYWFKVPLGGVCYPEGFRNFLEPALENPRIRKIRFVLDIGNETKRKTWHEMVLPLLREWAERTGRAAEIEEFENGGKFIARTDPVTTLGWVFDDLSAEFTPAFKFFVHDPDTDEKTPSEAQVFIATASRKVRFRDGSQHTIRVPDAVIRVHEDEDQSLLHALNLVANQWDTLF